MTLFASGDSQTSADSWPALRNRCDFMEVAAADGIGTARAGLGLREGR